MAPARVFKSKKGTSADDDQVIDEEDWRPVASQVLPTAVLEDDGIRVKGWAVKLPMGCVTASGVRVTCFGFHRSNQQSKVGLRQVLLREPEGNAHYRSTPRVVGDLQTWLHRASRIPDLEESSLRTSLGLGVASASQASMLRFCSALLGIEGTGAAEGPASGAGGEVGAAGAKPEWLRLLSPTMLTAVDSASRAVRQARAGAKDRLRQLAEADDSGEQLSTDGLMRDACFDPTLGGSQPAGWTVETSSRIRSVSGSTQICTVKLGGGIESMSSGQWRWSFKLVEDDHFNECTAFGICRFPVRTHNYSSQGEAWGIRSYNGQCYGSDFVQRNTKPIRRGTTAIFELDMDAGTLSMQAEGQPMEIVFNNLQGGAYLPFASSYTPNRVIELERIERIMSPEEIRAAEAALAAAEAATGGAGGEDDDGLDDDEAPPQPGQPPEAP